MATVSFLPPHFGSKPLERLYELGQAVDASLLETRHARPVDKGYRASAQQKFVESRLGTIVIAGTKEEVNKGHAVNLTGKLLLECLDRMLKDNPVAAVDSSLPGSGQISQSRPTSVLAGVILYGISQHWYSNMLFFPGRKSSGDSPGEIATHLMDFLRQAQGLGLVELTPLLDPNDSQLDPNDAERIRHFASRFCSSEPVVRDPAAEEHVVVTNLCRDPENKLLLHYAVRLTDRARELMKFDATA